MQHESPDRLDADQKWTAFGVQNILDQSGPELLRNSIQMITVIKNQIVSLTVDVIFSKK